MSKQNKLNMMIGRLIRLSDELHSSVFNEAMDFVRSPFSFDEIASKVNKLEYMLTRQRYIEHKEFCLIESLYENGIAWTHDFDYHGLELVGDLDPTITEDENALNWAFSAKPGDIWAYGNSHIVCKHV